MMNEDKGTGAAPDDFGMIMENKRDENVGKEEQELWMEKKPNKQLLGNRYLKEEKGLNPSKRPIPVKMRTLAPKSTKPWNDEPDAEPLDTILYIELQTADVMFRDQGYPSNFPQLDKILNNYHLTTETFARLRIFVDKHQYLDDDIINASFLLLPDVASRQGISLVSFSTLFFQAINSEDGVIRACFRNWAALFQVTLKNVWLIPVNYEKDKHWILLIVIHNLKIIVHLDSLHWELQQSVVDGLCTFVDSLSPDEPIKWSEWQIYSPTDNSIQPQRHGIMMAS
ncbi:hypothetical protein QAD02_008321 [Eretmocerus hayati]|uniref:Uncharacterized protein n=1 Tax=Eretmocerus hayati TaxID=131215 RepID=A0ACC2N6I4_9HYME|nr:hypothetical protein QAD02_008321 [Eretmocerus hayati]